jgi:glycerophosphoryl diester phosphodiesterase
MGDSETRLESFEKAIRAGIEMVEFDLRMTEDGHLVVYHGPPGMEGKNILREQTLSEVTKEIGRKPPLFSEVLEMTNGRIRLAIEVKEADIIDQILDEAKALPEDSFAIISFLDSVVRRTKDRDDSIPAGLILGMGGLSFRQRMTEIFPARRKRDSGADFLGPERRIYAMSPVKHQFKDSFVWGLNEDEHIKAALGDSRIAGVITDHPKRALEIQKSIFST